METKNKGVSEIPSLPCEELTDRWTDWTDRPTWFDRKKVLNIFCCSSYLLFIVYCLKLCVCVCAHTKKKKVNYKTKLNFPQKENTKFFFSFWAAHLFSNLILKGFPYFLQPIHIFPHFIQQGLFESIFVILFDCSSNTSLTLHLKQTSFWNNPVDI